MLFIFRIVLVLLTGCLTYSSYAAQSGIDPLPSWNDTATKKDLIQFVEDVTRPQSAHYVAPSERIATIDNDGTLWVEQPLYTQAIFALDRVKTLAPQHPEWKNIDPFKTVLSGNREALTKLTVQDFEKIIAVTHTGMTVEQFHTMVKQWLETTPNPRFKHPYIDLIYQPMLEVIHYLQQHDFKTYIVTGGGQEFVRAYGEEKYHIPSEQTIGSAGKTHYGYQNGKPVLIKLAKILLIDDYTGKPESIELFIGKKPLIAFGNSDGDRQMLEWTQSRPGAHWMALVHHDDGVREFAYGPASKVGTFSNALEAEAKKQGWHIISMKDDWKRIFPFDESLK